MSKPTDDAIVEAVEIGNRTSADIAAFPNTPDKASTRKDLKRLAEDEGRLERERSGQGYRYYPAEDGGSNGDSDEEDGEGQQNLGSLFGEEDGGEEDVSREGLREQVCETLEESVMTPEEFAEGRDDVGPQFARNVMGEMMQNGELARDEQSGCYFVLEDGEDGDDEQEAGSSGPSEAMAALSEMAYDPDEEEGGTANGGFDFGSQGDEGIPANREYVWDDHVPSIDGMPEYREYDTEFTEFVADIVNKDRTGKFPHAIYEGEAGTAKTLLSETVAGLLNAPHFTLQCSSDMGRGDIMGRVHIGQDETYWTDGVVTKALLASQERNVVLLIDEVNRASSRRQTDLFPALDHRCRLELSGRDGEIIEGNPNNLIVIGTINSGKGYQTEPIDDALNERFGSRFETEYLGYVDQNGEGGDPAAEAELVAEQSGVTIGDARELVDAANAVRQQAAPDSGNDNIRKGISTRVITRWAQSAVGRQAVGLNDPVMRAAISDVVNAEYDGDAATEIERLLNDRLSGKELEEA